MVQQNLPDPRSEIAEDASAEDFAIADVVLAPTAECLGGALSS